MNNIWSIQARRYQEDHDIHNPNQTMSYEPYFIRAARYIRKWRWEQ